MHVNTPVNHVNIFKLSNKPYSGCITLSVTFGVRVSKQEKKEMDEILNEVPNIYPDADSKGKALKKIFDIYLERIELTDTSDLLDTEIKRALDIINCTYLRYEGESNGFMCNEFLYRKKKGDSLGFDPEHTIIRCKDCRTGKEEQKELQIERLLQKDSIKKILDLRKTLLTMIGKGFDVEAFMCKGDYFEQDACYFSKDGLHLPCPIVDDDHERLALVSINDVCKETINPDTLRLPCEHLVNLQHKVFIPDFEDIMKKADEEVPQLEQQPPVKSIEVESTVIEDDSQEKEDDPK